MQRAEDSSSKVAPEPPGARRSFSSPGIAFAMITILALVTGGLLYLTRPDPAPATPVTPIDTTDEPDFSLTDEEAIARFRHLHRTLIRAYETRDITLLDAFLADGSPLADRARNEIGRLLKDRVIPVPRFETREIRVHNNSPEEIVLWHEVVDSSRFQSVEGRSVTRNPKRVLRVIEWRLKPSSAGWLIYDSKSIRSRVLAST